ncbi:fatty acid synthase-like [Metopolophium dirhodum]|uniref:fatty acid synthase-like n=1 Tax=Metopolophium dirhodum TaxID=44670 RepID=UPI00298FC7B1|nr:fatty acid synthase-like [Metopolophium dirhodum]
MSRQQAIELKIKTDREIALRAGRRLVKCDPGDEIVISGFSGSFPNSDGLPDFADNLFNKVDLISDDNRRWTIEHPEIPQRTGKLNQVNKFDAAFFGVHYKQAHTMDPMCRIILEKSYEAIVDSGNSPKSLKGSKTGVFVGACFSESEKTWFYEKLQVNGFGLTGCARAMLANRISYWLGVNGPSYSVDSACSSSLYALEHAYKAIRDGHCDSALVGGCNLCLHPYVSLQFARLGVLCTDGRCKSFDEAANGYVRSEAVCVLYLQKAKNAKRVYAKVVHAKTNCDGYKEQGITYPSGPLQQRLLEEFYEECEIKPSDLAWIEAHGTGTKVGDPEEVKALENVFCPGRTGPLLIGSVKSNIGHSEPASGLCSVAKVIIAMESGFIPPNINFNTPREDITAFYNGRINVVADKTPWNGGLVGINSFGFGGANCHVLLNWNNKSKINNGLPEDDLPRLVVASGRTEEAVTSLLNDFLSRSLDKEYVRLLQDVQAEQIPGHIYRGYTIIKKDCKANHSMDLQYYSGESRSVCFVFSGMGSQWTGMGTSLMQLPIFNESILKSHSILKEFGIDLVKIITSTDANILNNTVNSFVGIAAMQIALFDVLVAIGITPDIIIGHSIGELVCAYADGCLTSEQTIKVAYYYGLATLNSKIPLGAMAFVGIGYNQIKDLLPTNVVVAWHNSPDSCAISGLKESVEQFVLKLKSKDISTQMINVLNTPYHSTSIKKAIPSLLEYLKNIITNPKLRSEKWLSTSVPEEQWGEDKAKYCSAEYCANNLLNSVLFDETFEHVPKGSVLIELSPHGVLQDVLNRSHKTNITNVDLASRNHKDGIEYLLSAFGKIFEAGLNPKISNLYPDIEFPVSRGTPMIAPLVRWEHSEDWYVTMYRVQDKIKSGERNISISLKDEEHEYLSGHVIDGRNLFPATGYLVMAWETLALMRGELYSEVPVVFENVRFQRATNIPKDGNVEFIVMVQKGSGTFEVVESGAPVVTGRLYIPTDANNEMIDMPPHPDEPNDTDLNIKDIYKELRLRGYNYKGMFRSLNRVNLDATVGRVGWFNNWVAFMDNMLQIQILKEDTRALFVPTSLQKLFINVKKHATILQTLPEDKPEFPVYVYPEIDLIQAGGVEIRGLHANVIAKRKPLADPVIEKYTFVPNIIETGYTLEQIVRISLHLVIENLMGIKVKTVEILNKTFNPDVQILSPIILDVLADLPLIQPEVSILSDGTHPQLKEIGSNITVEDKKLSPDQSVLFAVGSGVLQDSNFLEQVFATLKPGGFLLTREKLNVEYSHDSVEVCLDASLEQERLMLVRKPLGQNIVPIVVKISSTEFSWLPVLQKLLKADDASVSQKIVLVGEKDPTNGIVGLLNCIRKEPGGDRVRCVFILDKCAPSFSLDEPLYKKQLNKDLILNVYKNKVWGSYRHLLLEPPSLIEVQHSCVNTSIRGDLSSLKWFQGSIVPFTKQPAESDLAHVYYTALNFRDIMLATAKLAPEVIARGRINQESVIGFEYSGRLESGERIMGMITSRALTNILVYDKYLSWKVPDSWSLEEAATVPVVYGTVIYALIVSGRMKRGDSVLIHAGTGGVGQAAITIALYYECEIFTTVGTAEKREFIKTHFPQIPESHIGNSRDSSFEQMIMMETDGKGVDMVLNSLAEEKLLASVRCLATGGRFLEIGKFDLANNSMIGMELFLKEISFHGVMLDTLFDSPNEWKQVFQRQVQENIDSGAIRPLVRTVFESDQVEPAFRYMAAGKHIGKVLIKIRDEEEDRFIKPQSINVKAYPRVTFDKNSSCIICGGLGGFGLELADWMVLRNSRNIILTTRTGIRNGYQALRKRVWESYGANVVISTADITTEEGVKQLLNEANKLGPVSTIFNLAVVLKDALFENQTEEDFKASAGPKAIATSLLDKYSRTMCPELKHFVIFSSVSCGRGNAGQTNYGMSNSVMERICEIRHSEGLPALAVEWGAVGEVGLVADMAEDNQEVVIGGTLQQKIGNCLEILDDLLTQKNNPIVSSMVVAEKRASSSNAGTIVDTVINILGLRDLKTISLHSTLAELGMDSMMAVEIKQTLERQFEVFLTPQDIRSMTFAKLQEIGSSDDKEKEADFEPKSIAQMPDVGLGYLIRAIGEESSAYNSVMRIPSLCEDGSVVEQPTTKLNTLFVIPGLEGISSIMEPLSKNLNMQVLCLQYDILGTASTIEEMAATHYTLIQERLAADQEFSIVGYSFGGLIAIEVLKMLEKNNRTGQLWLIDSAPQFLKMTTELAIRGDKTQDQEIQVQLILRFLDLVWPHNKTKFTTELYQINSWNERLNYFIEQVPDDVVYSKDYQKQLLNCAYIKLKAIINYDGKPNGSLKTRTLLIRPTEQVLPISEDYGLSEYFNSAVMVHFVEGNHYSILENKKVAELISQSSSSKDL